MKYYPRYLDQVIERKLKSSGAILIAGPKFSGKTTTCLRFAKSVYRINTKNIVEVTSMNPKIALEGEKPHLIDEWQKVPDIWNYVKEDLDIEYQFGKYLLTGSTAPVDLTQIQHDGAGRIVPLVMRPLSLSESNESKKLISLKELFQQQNVSAADINGDFSIQDLAFLVCRGGWPLSLQEDKEVALDITSNYYAGLFTFQDSENGRFRNKNPETLRRVMKSYARNISTEASIETMVKDVRQNDERSMDRSTFREYQTTLKDLYLIEDMEAWCPEIRSKTAIISTPTRHFVDASLACQALEISREDLLHDLKTFGLFFEDFAIRDLRVYSDLLNGKLKHYRDNAGLECDATIHLANGKWGAIEIKLGGKDQIEYGASRLNLLKNKLKEKSSVASPSFLMVLTGFGPLYQREDGIYVVPINTLTA